MFKNLANSFNSLKPVRPWMHQVTGESAASDAVAGITNAAIVLPQGVAFAVIAGLPPHYGLFTAMLTPVVAAIWGSSMVMVSGPTTAISAILFATLSEMFPPGTPDYIAAAMILTVLVGVFQLAAGLLRLGVVVSFISHSVMVGFTAAAAILIGTSQIHNILGTQPAGSTGLLSMLEEAVALRREIKPLSIFLAAVTFCSILLFSKIGNKFPSYLAALIFGSAAGWLLDAEAHGIRTFEALPSITPALQFPGFDLALLANLAPGAATVAFIGVLEALSIGRAFSVRRDERYDANQEIVGQGLSNFLAGFLQAYAGSGSFTRSALNAESGAETPLSAIFASAFLFLFLLLLSPFVVYVPVPVMAGVIAYAAFKLIKPDEVLHIVQSSPSDSVILALTFLTGIFTHLETAVIVGLIASLVVFLKQSSSPFVAVIAPTIEGGRRSLRNARIFNIPECPQIRVLRMEGPLYFGSVEQLETEFENLDEQAPEQTIKIFSLKGVGRLDLSGADFLLRQIRAARRKSGDFHIVAMYGEVLAALHTMHVTEKLGEDNLHLTKGHALKAALQQVDEDVCAKCKLRVFNECKAKPAPDDFETKRPFVIKAPKF